MPPDTRYALSRGGHIAFQCFGEGELDLLIVPAFLSNIELGWDHPQLNAFLKRIARASPV